MDAISIGAAGMTSAMGRLNTSATRIANGGASGDMAVPVVDMMQAKQDFEGSLAVMKTADKMMGSLLDMLV